MHISELDSMYHIDGDFYMGKIEQIQSNAVFSKFASTRLRFEWIANTIPDKLFKISQIA